MRWGRLLVIFVLVAVVGVLALWLHRERARDGAMDRPGPEEGPSLSRLRPRPLEQPAGPALAWLWRNGGAARRIAGRVVHAGRPVAKAAVRLTTEELTIGEWVLTEIETDQEGRFDFGPRPPTRYRVVAQAEGLAAGGVAVELRVGDPRPPPDDVTIELRDCELVVSGTVREAAGGIIAGARIRAATRAEVFGSVLSDDRGHYRICLLAGPAHIEAGADGYGTALEHTRGRRAARVDFALSPEVAIAGRVVNHAGEPVRGAAVIAETDGHRPGVMTESAADGGFRLDSLIAATYRVVARDDDRAAETSVALTTAGATAELVLTLEERATLTGRVIVGGRPAGDATVIVRSADKEWSEGSAVTQADGRFAVAGLPRGPVQIEVKNHKILSPDATIDLGAVSHVEVVCERLAGLAGRVVRAGKPVARAEVQLYQGWKRQHVTLSEDDGTFRFDGVPAASYDLVASSVAEGATTARRPIDVGVQDIAGLVLELDLAASIAGAVVDSSGAPVGGVMVHFAREESEAGENASDTTADDGTFLISGLAGGIYRPHLFRSRNGWAAIQPASGRRFPTVKVADGASRVTGVQLAILRGELTISGRAVRRGEAVAGIEIVAFSSAQGGEVRARSGADGTFVVEGLAAGTHEVHADQMGGEPIRVEAGARDIVLELPAGGRIEGVLSGFRTLPDVTVVGPNLERRADVTDVRFAIADVPTGTYDVSAASSGEHASARVTVTADQVSRLTLTASATAKLTGVVKDLQTGAPVAGLSCRWVIPGTGTGSTSQVVSDAAGGFSFAIPAGRIQVECFGESTPLAVAREIAVDVEPGATAHVAVEVVTLPRRSGTTGVGLAEGPSGSYRIDSLRGGAASSGLRVGDFLLAVDGLPVTGMRAHVVDALMRGRGVGARVELTVEREGAELTYQVVVEPEPAPPADE